MNDLIEGFILDSYQVDHHDYCEHHLWVKTRQQFLAHLIFDKEKSVFFVETQSMPASFCAETRALSLKSFSGQKVSAVYCRSDQQAALLKNQFEQQGVRTFEADIKSLDRFLMERFIFSSLQFKAQTQNNGDVIELHNPDISPGSFDKPQFRILSFDIETSRHKDLFSIAYHFVAENGEEQREVHIIAGKEIKEDNGFTLKIFPDQGSLVREFVTFFNFLDPDIVIGWHVIGFDFMVLEQKALKYGIDFSLGRDGSKVSVREGIANSYSIDIPGRQVLDGPSVLRSNNFKFSNYKLDTVAQSVLGDKKLINNQGASKVEEIERQFREDKLSLAKYNLQDCILVSKVFEKLNILSLMVARSIVGAKCFNRLAYTSQIFDYYYLPKLHRAGFVAPNISRLEQTSSVNKGGLVLTPKNGFHQYVIVVDFKSLYPSIIQTFNIEPLSRLVAQLNPNHSHFSAPSGQRFSRESAILPEYIKKLMQKRQEAKNKGQHCLAQSIKILMNSFYGVMGSKNSRFYHADLACAVTEMGRWVLSQAISEVEKMGKEVVYGDTDSLFIKLSGEDRFSLDEKIKHIIQTLNTKMAQKISADFGVDKCFLELEFETFYHQVYFPSLKNDVQAAKKRYVGMKMGPDAQMQLHFSGMEFVRSDWTQLAKDFQYQLFHHIFQEEDPSNWIKKFIDQLRSQQFDGALVYTKKLSKKPRDYTKVVPPHVKAALLLDNQGEDLREISYIMTKRGPIPLEKEHLDIDYEHYIDTQLRPIAEPVLQSKGKSFDEVLQGDQLSMFTF